jgi:hypothetical protein
MKKLSTCLLLFFVVAANAQSPWGRVNTMLNTKCQNSTCHSATATDGSETLKFDGDLNSNYTALFNVLPTNASSIAKHERLVKQQHPYYSFLLRKIAGAGFDGDLAIDSATEGALMKDINGNQLTKKEIEYVRQWITFGAKKTYSSGEPQPNLQLINDFYDSLEVTGIDRFLPKPPKPAAGTGIQLRMGPIFLPITGEIEQEYLQQQEVNFPVLPEIHEIDGFMNQQSHHFLLFKYQSVAASQNSNASDVNNLAKVEFLTTSFDGDKDLTSSWQNDANLVLPQGTALFWDQKTILDMNYHIKNYNASFVLPCDFYFNVLYTPRSSSTIEMKSQLSQQTLSLIVPTGIHTISYDDPVNNLNPRETRYLWMVAGHTHEWGTNFDLYERDSLGNLGDKIYDGAGIETNYGSYYDNSLGHWDWHHPPIEYWPDLRPITFGKWGNKKSGIVSKATYNNNTGNTLFFSTQTDGEMQLWYYMYTSEPLAPVSAINDDNSKGIYFDVQPNPMNTNGKLVYTLENNAKVESSIIDMTGKVIAQMLPENETTGTHEISIGNGEQLSSGIYFARLSINGVVYTKKFVVTQ